jgi:hypothetical protein
MHGSERHVTRIDLSPDDRPGTPAISIECDPDRFLGSRSAFGSTIWFPAKIVSATSTKLMAIGGWLRFANENDGLQIPMQPLTFNEPFLRVPISDEQIARLERKRGGQILMLEIVLRGTGFYGTAGAAPATFTASYQPPINVQRDAWLKVLEALGAGQRRLIELPAPPHDRGGFWEKASKQIDAAAWRLASGDAGGAMNEARTAMESALEAVGGVTKVPRKPKEPLRPFAIRVAAEIRKAHVDRGADPYAALASAIELGADIFGFVSDPLHNGLDSAERTNAELALSLVTSLYTYFARLPSPEDPTYGASLE